MKRLAEENSILELYIIVTGSAGHYTETFTVIDGKLIGETKDVELIIPLVLLAYFYVLNIFYPKGLFSFYSILEVVVLNTPLSKTSPSVQHVFTSIKNN